MPLPGGQTTPHTRPVYTAPAPVPPSPAPTPVPPTVTPAPGLDPGSSRLPFGSVPVIGGGGGGVGPYRYTPPIHVSPAPVPFPPVATLPYNPPVYDPGGSSGGGGGLPPSAVPGLPGAQLDLSKIPPVVWLVGLILLLRR